jgi:hypothetical protein
MAVLGSPADVRPKARSACRAGARPRMLSAHVLGGPGGAVFQWRRVGRTAARIFTATNTLAAPGKNRVVAPSVGA